MVGGIFFINFVLYKYIYIYVGLAAITFYKRHQNHKTTLKLRSHETKSELSKHIWQLKDNNISYDLSWKIMDRAMKFTPISKTCKLCTLERYFLICRKESFSLNKNIEFGDECLHKRFLRLSTVKWDNPVFVPCGPCLRQVDTSIFKFLYSDQLVIIVCLRIVEFNSTWNFWSNIKW